MERSLDLLDIGCRIGLYIVRMSYRVSKENTVRDER